MNTSVIRYLKVVALSCAVLVLAVGCRTAPIVNVKDAPVKTLSGKEPTHDQVTKAIVMAGMGLKWKMEVAEPGHIIGKLYLRSHYAAVDITYNTKTYSIMYKNSDDLWYDEEDQTIHSNYNGWIENLNNAIRIQLVAAG